MCTFRTATTIADRVSVAATERSRWSSCNIDEHMAIIEALEAGDERKSRTSMRLHLEAMFERAFTDAIKDETAYLADVIAKYAGSPSP
ncbi:MAG: FCD domain-containing protein [Alphaproteobacteria bacterium]